MTRGDFTAGVIFLGEAGFCQAHQLIEDCEFKFELDGVDHGFDGRFADVVVGEFERYEDDVHADTNAIDRQELDHDFTGHGMVYTAK